MESGVYICNVVLVAVALLITDELNISDKMSIDIYLASQNKLDC